MLDALESAARSGERVTVALEGRPYGDGSGTLAQANARAARRLSIAGAAVRFADLADGKGPPLHMKALVCDGVAYLDDRNFPSSGDTIVRDDSRSDARAVIAAADGNAASRRNLWFTKAGAEAGEAQLIDRAVTGSRIDLCTESFGLGSPVYVALERAAQRGVRCRLLVCERDLTPVCAHALRLMAVHGIDVRVGPGAEKLAIVRHTGAWVGSANATSAYYDGATIDWGLRTKAPSIVSTLQRRFNDGWTRSYAPLTPAKSYGGSKASG